MAYTAELIKEVKELFPESKDMARLADEGSVFLGRYLDDSSYGGLDVDTILLATSLEELQSRARIMKRKRQLYAKWCEQVPKWCEQDLRKK
jgi:hypothetical protein